MSIFLFKLISIIHGDKGSPAAPAFARQPLPLCVSWLLQNMSGGYCAPVGMDRVCSGTNLCKGLGLVLCFSVFISMVSFLQVYAWEGAEVPAQREPVLISPLLGLSAGCAFSSCIHSATCAWLLNAVSGFLWGCFYFWSVCT